MPLTFYHQSLSQPVRAIDMFLNVNGIEHERKAITLQKGEHKTEEYLKINPFGTIPAISHNEFNLSESVAILQYLCEAFEVPEHWYPKDLQKRARVSVYLNWQHSAIRSHGSTIFLEKGCIKLFGRDYGQPDKVAQSKVSFETSLNQLETIFLKDTPFISSNEISIADLLCVSELMQPMTIGYDMKTAHPKTMDYIMRVRERVGAQLFDSIQRPLFDQVGGTYIA